MENLIKKAHLLAWLTASLTFALSISVPKGYQLTTGVLFIVSLLSIFQSKQDVLDREDIKLALSFIVFALGSFGLIIFDDFLIKDFDRPSRFILVLVSLFFLLSLKSKYCQQWLWYGAAIGGVTSFMLAVYEQAFVGDARAGGAENEIIFGNVAVLLGFLSFGGVLFFYVSQRYFWFCLAVLGGFGGLGASFLSGSRGGWVAILVVSAFIFWQSRSLFSKRLRLVAASLVMALLAAVVLFPQTGVKSRIASAVKDVQDYQKNEKSTSVGLRFEMWKEALYMFHDSPLIGVGKHNSVVIRQELIGNNLVHPKVAKYTHAHNEYLNELALRGIVGFAFLMFVYLIPLKLFLVKAKQYENNWKVKPYAIAGATIPLCYMSFALTQSMFSHNTGVMMYAFPIVFLWAGLRLAEREAKPA